MHARLAVGETPPVMQVGISSQCASALDNLAGFYFKQYVANEDGPSAAGRVCAGLFGITGVMAVPSRVLRQQ